MPIKPENKARYPKNWKQIRAQVAPGRWAAGSALDYQMPQASRASVNPRLHARSVLPNADGETPARRAASAGASPSTSTSRAASAADTN